MSAACLHALADDLTGAAEIAAVGHGFGQRSFVTHRNPPPPAAGLVVHNTDTRLLPADSAVARVRETTLLLARVPGEFVFKKIDSVLRGPVVAEIEACALALGKTRALLIPANPSLGRTIRDGRYFIDGVPISETAFTHDPHHPALSSEVRALLGPPREWPVSLAKPSDPFPSSGVVIGEASSSADIADWAARVDLTTLAVGASEFFSALLQRRFSSETPPALRSGLATPGPTLLISGTTASTSRELLTHVPSFTLSPASPDTAALNSQLRSSLQHHHFAALAPEAFVSPDPLAPTRLAHAFAALASSLHATRSFHHLVLEGGATAAAILGALRWTQLEVVHTWARGVISLRPTAAPTCLITMKPGSYAWPANFLPFLSPTAPSSLVTH